MSVDSGIPTVELFGISISNVNMKEALNAIDKTLSEPGKHIVTTPNVDHIVRLQKDREFLEVYRKASLVFADGLPVVWASRVCGKPLKERVAGSDLVVPLCELAAKKGYRLYFLGGEPGVAEKAAAKLRASLPSIYITGTYAPPFGFESDATENQKIVQQINQARSDILFVCLGAPKQEKWIGHHMAEIDFKVAMCVGASIDFIAGVSRRAPRWMQRMGFEWLWRLVHEPQRLWKRYLVNDLAFIRIVLEEWLRLHGCKRGHRQANVGSTIEG